MAEYQGNFSKSWKQVVVLSCFPILMVGIMIPVLIKFKGLPEWATIAFIIGWVGLNFALLFWLMLKHVTVPAKISLSEQSFSIDLQGPAHLYLEKSINLPWDALKNFAHDIDSNNGNPFMLVSTHEPHPNFVLTPTGKEEQAHAAFLEMYHLMVEKSEQYTTQSGVNPTPITHESMYSKKWYRWLLIISGILGLIYVIAEILSFF